MGFLEPKDVVENLIRAYYFNRDVEAILSYVTEDIEWIGTEDEDSASNKEDLRVLLEKDVVNFPEAFAMKFSELREQKLGEDVVLITAEGKLVEQNMAHDGYGLRGTVSCVRTKDGWLAKNIHASVPNMAKEKYTLEKALAANRRLERAVMAGIPGGVAIYRIKKNGRVVTDYVSESMASMRGYTINEFNALSKADSRLSVAEEDRERLHRVMLKGVEEKIPVSVQYKVVTKDKGKLLVRLDAKVISDDSLLEDEDLALIYGVHSMVSDIDKEVAAQQKHLEELVGKVPVGIGIYDIKDGQAILLFLNDAYYKMMGYSRTERTQFLGKNHDNAVHPEDRPRVLAMVKSLIDGADEGTVQYRIRNKAEQWVWLNLVASVVERCEKNIKVYTAFTDCDDLINSQLENEAKQSQIQALLASIPGGVAVYRVKKDGRIPTDYISDSLARICGYDDAEDILRLMKEDSRKLVYPEDFPNVAEACRNSLATGAPTHTMYRVYAKDRSLVWVTLDSVVMKNVELGPDDTAVFYAVQASVSEEVLRAKAEQDYYRTILDITKTAYFEVDDEHNFYSSDSFGRYMVDQKEVRRITEGDLTGGTIYPEDVDKVNIYLDDLRNGKEPGSVVVRLKLKDGSYEWTEVTCHGEYDNNHEFKRMTGILRDVNAEWKEQKKALEEALKNAKSANAAKTAFLSRVSHDMRTPLNGILGLTNLLKDRLKEESNLRDLNELEMSGKYLLNLINDTLDMSRIESGKLELHPIVCDGRTFFDTAVGLAKTSMDSKHINYTVHADAVPFTMLYTDVARMEQVIMNVVSNAVKFTPEEGKIDITVKNISVEDGVITDHIIIKDNGIGMSKEFLPHIFDAFSQEDASRTSTSQGTGLGMAITKQLIQLMDGDITVESELGKGSTFTITTKMRMATPLQIEEWKKNQQGSHTSSELCGKRILLCEDHPLNAKIAIRLLEKKGIIVEHAENGKIGVEKFRDSAPGYYDAVLMDIRMPVMDGITATKNIRALERHDAKTIPVIAMTANAFSADREETKAAGMNAHLSKPIEPDIMFTTLATTILSDEK